MLNFAFVQGFLDFVFVVIWSKTYKYPPMNNFFLLLYSTVECGVGFKATFVLRFGGDKTPHNFGIILNYFQCLQFSLQTLRLDHTKI